MGSAPFDVDRHDNGIRVYGNQVLMLSFVNSLLDSLVSSLFNMTGGLWRSQNPVKQCAVYETVLCNHSIISEDKANIQKQQGFPFYFKGCVLHSIYSNKTDKDVAISQIQLKIDHIRNRSFKKVDMLCHYSEGQLYLYLINNGNIDVYDLQVKIDIVYDNEYSQENVSMLFCKKLLGDAFNNTFIVDHLSAGEILRLCIWSPDKEYYEENFHNHYTDRIVFQGSINEGKEILLSKGFLGALVINGEDLDYYYAQGDAGEVEGFSVKIKTKDQQPQSFALPVQFAIRGKGIKHVQVSVYPSETCAITYHFELMIAGKTCIQINDR